MMVQATTAPVGSSERSPKQLHGRLYSVDFEPDDCPEGSIIISVIVPETQMRFSPGPITLCFGEREVIAKSDSRE